MPGDVNGNVMSPQERTERERGDETPRQRGPGGRRRRGRGGRGDGDASARADQHHTELGKLRAELGQ